MMTNMQSQANLSSSFNSSHSMSGSFLKKFEKDKDQSRQNNQHHTSGKELFN